VKDTYHAKNLFLLPLRQLALWVKLPHQLNFYNDNRKKLIGRVYSIRTQVVRLGIGHLTMSFITTLKIQAKTKRTCFLAHPGYFVENRISNNPREVGLTSPEKCRTSMQLGLFLERMGVSMFTRPKPVTLRKRLLPLRTIWLHRPVNLYEP